MIPTNFPLQVAILANSVSHTYRIGHDNTCFYACRLCTISVAIAISCNYRVHKIQTSKHDKDACTGPSCKCYTQTIWHYVHHMQYCCMLGLTRTGSPYKATYSHMYKRSTLNMLSDKMIAYSILPE